MSDEGSIKFECRWHYGEAPTHTVVTPLLRTRNLLHQRGLVGVLPDGIGYGNVSARLQEESFLITGSGTGSEPVIDAKHLTLVCCVDFRSNSVECVGPVIASSESMTHAALYHADLQICAVIHVHSRELWTKLFGIVPTTDRYVPYGTPEMATEIERLYRDEQFPSAGIIVMAGHQDGLISFGRTFDEALSYLPDSPPESRHLL
jgi:L-ribulose-5-phosphate 4-epimerase